MTSWSVEELGSAGAARGSVKALDDTVGSAAGACDNSNTVAGVEAVAEVAPGWTVIVWDGVAVVSTAVDAGNTVVLTTTGGCEDGLDIVRRGTFCMRFSKSLVIDHKRTCR